jgi:hypothetical protein
MGVDGVSEQATNARASPRIMPRPGSELAESRLALEPRLIIGDVA